VRVSLASRCRASRARQEGVIITAAAQVTAVGHRDRGSGSARGRFVLRESHDLVLTASLSCDAFLFSTRPRVPQPATKRAKSREQEKKKRTSNTRNVKHARVAKVLLPTRPLSPFWAGCHLAARTARYARGWIPRGTTTPCRMIPYTSWGRRTAGTTGWGNRLQCA
jgi:hypothetical protein